jgi:N-acetyl-gamma-glutamyl-phosphate/LysW-gamma-L-alpha-aminoadipyl-6-phosphate reductase
VIQELGVTNISLTMTAVDLVRGVLATAHARVKPGVTTKDLWKAYRAAANENPFIRIVKEQRGIYRVPEPKILAGSNYADLGFDLDENNGHVVSMCAIDNLMKGASGSAVQCMNLMLGLDEMTGLEFAGLHPILPDETMTCRRIYVGTNHCCKTRRHRRNGLFRDLCGRG